MDEFFIKTFWGDLIKERSIEVKISLSKRKRGQKNLSTLLTERESVREGKESFSERESPPKKEEF